MSEPSSQSIAPVGGFIGQICAYFRDFLDTDFRKQRMPKRSIGLRDTKGNLTGISVAKYPELTSDLWRQLGKQLDANRQFSIKTDKPSVKVSWQVTGIRQDAWANAHRIPVEELKPEKERGLYLHPELFGAAAEKSITAHRHPDVQKLE